MTISVSINSDIRDAFKRYLRERNMKPGLVVNQALRQYLSDGGFL